MRYKCRPASPGEGRCLNERTPCRGRVLLREAADQIVMPLWRNLGREDITEKSAGDLTTSRIPGARRSWRLICPHLSMARWSLAKRASTTTPVCWPPCTRTPRSGHRPAGRYAVLRGGRAEIRHHGLSHPIGDDHRSMDSQSTEPCTDERGERLWRLRRRWAPGP